MYADARSSYWIAPLILRLALAAIFLFHGFDKVVGADKEWGAAWATILWQKQDKMPADVEQKFDQVLAKPGVDKQAVQNVRSGLATLYAKQGRAVDYAIVLNQAVQLAVAWGELLGGLAMLLGVLTRLAAIGLIIIQIGAIATVTLGRGFSTAAGGGYEYNIALVAMCLALVVTGAGLVSVDHWWSLRRRGSAAAAPPPTVPTTV